MEELPINHPNIVLEKISERHFINKLPPEWITDKLNDYGIDLLISIVQKREVTGLYFAVQLKAKKDCKGKYNVSIKKTTLNYLFNRLEPAMIILYDQKTGESLWKWLIHTEFDLSQAQKTFTVSFDKNQKLSEINWEDIKEYVQKIFKIQKQLLTSQEYDLFNTSSELEIKAWAHYFAGNKHEAIFNFRRLLRLESKAIWYLALAQCEYATYDYANALHNINLALELDSCENILQTKACILAEDGIKNNDIYKVKSAEKIFAQLYNSALTSVNCYNYANTLNHLGKNELAETLYKKALSLKPGYAECWKNLGQLYDDLHKHKEALNCYNRALQINPSLPQAIVSKGINIGITQKKYSTAIKLLWQGINLDKDIFVKFPRTFYWLAYFYSELNQPEEALLWINRGIEHHPGNYLFNSEKIRIFRNHIETHQNLIDRAILFFEDLHELKTMDSVAYLYWCEALALKNGINCIESKIYKWYIQAIPFKPEITARILKQYKPDELMNNLRYWNKFSNYLKLYPIDKIEKDLQKMEVTPSHSFLIEFEVNRITLLSNLQHILTSYDTTDINKTKIVDIALATADLFTAKSLSSLITAQDVKSSEFNTQFSKTLTATSFLYFTEFPRTLGFSIGLHSDRKHLLSDSILDDNNLFLEILSRFAKHLYMNFGLPLE